MKSVVVAGRVYHHHEGNNTAVMQTSISLIYANLVQKEKERREENLRGGIYQSTRKKSSHADYQRRRHYKFALSSNKTFN